MEFFCKSEKCKSDGDKPYVAYISTQVYERHNIATMFCPHCGGELVERSELVKDEPA